MSSSHRIAPCLALALIAACSNNAPSTADPAAPAPTGSTAAQPSLQAPRPAEADSGDAPAGQAPAFAGKTWKVVESSGVQAGTTYAFLADGTLVIESGPGNPPGYGKWTYTDGKLSIEEEGIAYPTDIVSSDADHLELRSHNPGGTLDIRLERVPDAVLPKTP